MAMSEYTEISCLEPALCSYSGIASDQDEKGKSLYEEVLIISTMLLKCSKRTAGLFIITVVILLMINNRISAQGSSSGDPIIVPGPDPFSLDVVSAIYCINLLKNNRFLEKNEESGSLEVIEVETIWSWFLDYDESLPEGYRKRYDIIVNGSPLNWDNSFVEYGGEMLNLRLLFLYRNQYPPENLEYYPEN